MARIPLAKCLRIACAEEDPTDPGDPREAELCADYNADSIEKRERFPRLRDLSMFIGSFDELPDLSFGPGLPGIRSWSRRWVSSVWFR